MHLTQTSLEQIFRLKHGDPDTTGSQPRRRYRFGYFTPDDVYEATISQLVFPGAAWLDVGGGRELFPTNPTLARQLSQHCGLLVGVDPSDNIEDNPYMHQKYKCLIEEYRSDQTFDLATLRMVAEHITKPEQAVASLARLVRPGGKVVVYTVNWWSPVSLLSWLVPFRHHHWIKCQLWGAEEKDTFPVSYLMNGRRRLRRIFENGGFVERRFAYLDDCRTFARFPWLGFAELIGWRSLNALGLHYPETCLLGIYERVVEEKKSRHLNHISHQQEQS